MKNTTKPNSVPDEECRFSPPSRGIYLIWEVTNYCNLRCLHCCTQSGPNVSTENDVSTDRMILAASELVDVGVTRVLFSGGEPLLRSDFLQVVRAVRPRHIEVHIASNGSPITAEIASELSVLGVSGVDISLDGHTGQIHNQIRLHPQSFQWAVDSIRMCNSVNLAVRVTSTVNKGNSAHIEEFVQSVIELGVKHIVLQTVLGAAGRASENESAWLDEEVLPRLVGRIRELQKRFDDVRIDLRFGENHREHEGCPAGDRILHIAANGDVSPCSWLYKLDPIRFCAGNIKHESLMSCMLRLAEPIEPLIQLTNSCLIPYARNT